MSLDYIRSYYCVPAIEGGRIRFTWDRWTTARDATIVAARGQYLSVRFDDGETGILHPTWEVEYLPAEEVAQ